MKKSSILLLGAFGVIFISLLILVIFFRVSADNFIHLTNDPDNTVEAVGIIDTISIPFDNFDSLNFNGVWNVVVKQSDDYTIEITADKALLNELDIEKKGTTIDFSHEKYLNGGSESKYNITVFITSPNLKLIKFAGMGNMLLQDFNIETLDIINSGASNIKAEGVTIEMLNLVVSGAANAELSNINIKNCHLDISGAANIELNMTGGELSGLISGAASVVYGGSVSSESVRISGIGSLQKK